MNTLKALTKANLLIIAILLSNFSYAQIDLNSMEKDLTFLASDELKGRASFTPEIDLAANYIAKRFQSIGLTPFNQLSTPNTDNHSITPQDFLQTFSVHHISPEDIFVEINGQSYRQPHIAIATNQAEFHWQSLENIQVTKVHKRKDLFTTLSTLNVQGGQHLVLVHPEHKHLFKQYRSFFKKGSYRLTIKEPATIVMVYSQAKDINTINIRAKNTIQNRSLSNVVAVMPGTTKADEFIIFSAHYDHLGVKPGRHSPDHDVIFNGADDDASGTTAVIQLAEHFAKYNANVKGDIKENPQNLNQNQRTIIFAAFTAEEIGGFGSQYFAQHLPADKIKAMINIEMIGKPSKFGEGTFWMTGYERSDLALLMNETLKNSPDKQFSTARVYADPYLKQQLFYRSDNATLARLGVPAHSFSSTQLDRDRHYHKVSDEVESLTLSSMAKIINTLAIASQDLVNGSKTPSRVDTSQVTPTGKVY
ncbi:M28 family metallopeptidase [Thalassotalea agariperforans]